MRSFKAILGNLSESMEEERAQEQLINLLKTRRIGEYLIDLVELKKLMAGIKVDFDDDQLSPEEDPDSSNPINEEISEQKITSRQESLKSSTFIVRHYGSNNKLILQLREFLLRLGLEHWIGNVKKKL